MCVLESPCAKKNRRNGVRQQPGILHGTFEVKSREKKMRQHEDFIVWAWPKRCGDGKTLNTLRSQLLFPYP
jgi:hypothetical protein